MDLQFNILSKKLGFKNEIQKNPLQLRKGFLLL